jgi:uncharacterized cofD-like protein
VNGPDRGTRTADEVSGPGDGSRAVAIGGGHGISRTLQALPRIVDHVTAVVTVADDGGSSGRLRRDLDVLPPGDLRMALTSLARDRDLADLISYRFQRGELAGHALGNLVLVAQQELSGGDLVAALDRLCAVLRAPGRVLPCATVPLTLLATTPAGPIRGQTVVAATARLERVRLDPVDPPATPEAVQAIERADLVVLGPGSLYTSLLPNLLVPGIRDALVARAAPLVFVANLREQPGETEGLSLAAHLAAVTAHVPELRVDVLVTHDGPAPSGPGLPLTVDAAVAELHVDRVVAADLLDGADGHDPAALARVLDRVLRG